MKNNIKKQSVQADGSDGEKMSADFDDEQGYNVRGFTIDGKIVVETIKEMKMRRCSICGDSLRLGYSGQGRTTFIPKEKMHEVTN